MTTAEIGKKGERLAARYLRRHGYRILAKNWRSHRHEIDVIARERKTADRNSPRGST